MKNMQETVLDYKILKKEYLKKRAMTDKLEKIYQKKTIPKENIDQLLVKYKLVG